jgi:hypothetical protein
MSQELMYLEQLFGRSGSAWLPVTMLGGLLLALIFRPGNIHNLYLFRAACWLLALSVIVTPLLNLLLSLMTVNFPGGMRFGSSPSGPQFIYVCVNAVGPIMQGASILCGLFSLIPPATPRPYVAGPVKHPLE